MENAPEASETLEASIARFRDEALKFGGEPEHCDSSGRAGLRDGAAIEAAHFALRDED